MELHLRLKRRCWLGERERTLHMEVSVKTLQWRKGYTCEDRIIFRYSRLHKVKRRGHEMSLETLAGLLGAL